MHTLRNGSSARSTMANAAGVPAEEKTAGRGADHGHEDFTEGGPCGEP